MTPLTTVQLSKKLNIPRSTIYYKIKTGVIPSPAKKANRAMWTQEHIDKLNKIIGRKNKSKNELKKPAYKTISMNNRRYLGNKYKLISVIKHIIHDECRGVNTIADIFAGTGVVAAAFPEKKVICNDILYSNYICHYAWLSNEEFSKEKIIKYIQYYNSLDVCEDNYMSINFSDTYFSLPVCRKIGYIREDTERLFSKGEINARERAILITSLLYAMDKIANTCGHYDAYRHGAEMPETLELCVPVISENINPNNQIYHVDANELVKSISADVVYIDPPYNSRQYCDAYHLLENVSRWEKPPVRGVARKMDRRAYKSDYCTSKATEAFERLIENIKAKYILLSYNNMAEKGDDRSNAKIKDEDIYRILSKKGEVKVFEKEYKAFNAGKSNINENIERLFLCTCHNADNGRKGLIQSPLNYIGGKYKLLPQILPLFPDDINQFIDLFCGGCNVGINCGCSKVVFNDSFRPIIDLFNIFKDVEKNRIFESIDLIVDKYGLSRSEIKGYEFYGCNGSDGLGKYNKDKYLKLREDFNGYSLRDDYYFMMLYVLIVYSFNNQIRFNKKGKFNLPVGKRDFNGKMKKKLSLFIDQIKSKDCTFMNQNFNKVPASALPEGSFVYADPPYLITCATYNERDGWNEAYEKQLLDYLDDLNNHKIRFALSNVLSSKGKRNDILLKWIQDHQDKYHVIHLDYDYSNSNYHTRDKTDNSDEVLIMNYSREG